MLLLSRGNLQLLINTWKTRRTILKVIQGHH